MAVLRHGRDGAILGLLGNIIIVRPVIEKLFSCSDTCDRRDCLMLGRLRGNLDLGTAAGFIARRWTIFSIMYLVGITNSYLMSVAYSNGDSIPNIIDKFQHPPIHVLLMILFEYDPKRRIWSCHEGPLLLLMRSQDTSSTASPSPNV